MSESTNESTPQNTPSPAPDDPLNLLPRRSQMLYNKTYEKFLTWKKTNNEAAFSESVILSYFNFLAENLSPATLWAQYSMLKTTILLNDGVNIKTYAKLTSFLKRKSVGYKSKKAKTLTSSEVEKFLNEAPDEIYLASKAILIFGISGGCKRDELCNITISDVKIVDSTTILVQLPKTKSIIARSFTIVGAFCEIIKKYMAARPKNTEWNRFFLKYYNGKCYQQPIGINKIGGIPRIIANYLNLSEPELYTGHTFRRTSAKLLADAGADYIAVKRHGGWRSNSVAENCTNNSSENNEKITNNEKIARTETPPTEEINEVCDDDNESDDEIQIETEKAPSVLPRIENNRKLNLDGFKFVVVEIDRRIEVVQKGWSPPEGAEYVKPHAIFDSYKNASDFAETVNVKKTQRPVAEVTKANPEVISIDGDNSSKRFTIKVNKNIQGKVVEINKNIPRRIVPGNFKANYQTVASKVIRSQFKLTNSGSGIASGGGSGSSSTSNSRPSSVTALGVNKNPKRIIGTMVNKSTPVISVAGGNKITKTKRFIGTLVNKKVNNNSSVTAPAEVNKNVSQNTNNSVQQNLEKQNLNPGNVIIVVEKVDNSSNLITGDVNPTTAQVETDVKDPTLTSNPPPPSQETSEILEPTIKEDPTIKEEFINEEFIDEDDLMVVDPLEI